MKSRSIFVAGALALLIVQFGSLFPIIETGGFSASSYPAERGSSFGYTNRTLPLYPTIDSSPQKSSPSNQSLFEEMIGLTTVQPETWRDFSLNEPDIFLAIDGASQSRVLRVLIEVYSPSLSLVAAKNTTSSTPIHTLILSPAVGTWQLHLKIMDTGNTTAWLQAKSYHKGSKLVSDYQKERLHLYAGQALYFKIPVESDDWVDMYSVRLAGSTTRFELYKPLEFYQPWVSRSNTFDQFYSAQALPSTGVYLLVITNEGDADVMVQITLPDGVSDTLTPTDRFVIEFALDHENEHFYFVVNRTFSWVAMDGAINNANEWARYRLIDPSMNTLIDQTSDRVDEFISKVLGEPLQGTYILILRASAEAQATVQFTASGDEDGVITIGIDQNISFTLSGQTVYYRVPSSPGLRFLYLATSLNTLRSEYRIFDFRIDQVWYRYSRGPNQPKYSWIVSVGGDYLVQVQGSISSEVMIHFRFVGEEDYSLTTPDYSDFKLRFSGDLILFKVSVGSSQYFFQYWHSLNNSFVTFWVHNPDLQHMGGSSHDDVNDESRYAWTENDASFVSGYWMIAITGVENAVIRLSQLQTGDEDRIASTPFHVFEEFDFDYHAKTFLINIPECLWLSIVAQSQTDGKFNLIAFDSEMARVWDVYKRYKTETAHRFWKNPNAGSWLMIVDGRLNTNLSLTFYTSADPMSTRITGQHYTDDFAYYGEAQYYRTSMTNSSFLAVDAMWLANGLRTYLNLIDPEGNILHSTYSDREFDVKHFLLANPENGTWHIMYIGFERSKIISRLVAGPDQMKSLPFADMVDSDFDGKVTYISFIVNNLADLEINATSNIDTDTWLWLHDPAGQSRYSYRFTSRGAFRSIVINGPADGQWLLCLVQEVFANLTVSCGGDVEPIPPQTGIIISFVYPSDTQVFAVNGSFTVLPQLNGTINAVVNATDFYHTITMVHLYYKGGINYTNMEYNSVSGFYEAPFNTTLLEDGLHELVAFAQCQIGEIGIASVSILINNNGTFPTFDDYVPPEIRHIYQEPDGDQVQQHQTVLVRVEVEDRDTEISLVLLSYSTDDGQTFEDVTMYRQDKYFFKAQIPGLPAGTNVKYAVKAYDYVGNGATDNNAGEYYIYDVIPEFPLFAILPLLIIASLAVVMLRKKGKY